MYYRTEIVAKIFTMPRKSLGFEGLLKGIDRIHKSVSIIDEWRRDRARVESTILPFVESFPLPVSPSRRSTLVRPKWFRPDDGLLKLENASTPWPGNNYLLQASHEVRATPRWNCYSATLYALMSVKMSCTFFASQFVLIQNCKETNASQAEIGMKFW